MSCRIRILDPALADQIAAGEVIERAASVVKELAENSLDAGARQIQVEVQAGGRALIRVIDDGGGMTPEEARLAVARHATSKLARAEDLWGLASFGFRGEALPSIAAVSRFTLTTRPPEQEQGFELRIEGGRVVGEQVVGCAPGTQIEVRDLFYNVPARLKFQKAEATEVANVAEALVRLALAHPEVHVRLRSSGRVTLDLPPHRDLGERVRAALARRGSAALHEVRGRHALPIGHVDVHAFLGAPEDASTTSRSTYILVGRRFVRDRGLLQALALGYGELLERARYPLAVLFVDAPPEEVDINVHPQKLEVRFASAQRIQAAVRHTVRDGVLRAPWLARPVEALRTFSLPPGAGGGGGLGAGGARGAQPGAALVAAGARTPPGVDLGAALAGGARAERRFDGGGLVPPAREAAPVVARLADAAEGEGTASAGSPWVPGASGAEPEPRGGGAGFFAALRYLGQVDRTYLACEAPGELVLVDQHAAHERTVFERLRRAFAARELARQHLLFPVPIDLDPLLAGQLPALLAADALPARLGFEAEPFGASSVLVRAVPELLAHVEPRALFLDVLARAAEDGAEGEAAPSQAALRIDRVLATMACHAAVRAGDVLGPAQARALLDGLDALDLGTHCPHGRPVLLRLPVRELERRFGRA